MIIMKKSLLFLSLLFIFSFIYADPFNDKLTAEERQTIASGEILIKNINFDKYMCLTEEATPLAPELISVIKDLNPKYLAEVIQIKPYKENEDLPERLEKLLDNVPEYAGIPYFSERKQKWYRTRSNSKRP